MQALLPEISLRLGTWIQVYSAIIVFSCFCIFFFFYIRENQNLYVVLLFRQIIF